MLRLIREVEPPTPSSRISTSHTLPSLAATRHIEPARLGRFVRGDLDWIVMKALAKERQRRYESPIAFAQDIERFLNHEPVSAGPPTASYRFKKFVRRNRRQVIAASLVLLALVGGIIGTTLGWIEARNQRQNRRRTRPEAKAEPAPTGREAAHPDREGERHPRFDFQIPGPKKSGEGGQATLGAFSVTVSIRRRHRSREKRSATR